MTISAFKTMFAISAVAATAILAESCAKQNDSTIEFETRTDSIGYMVPDFYGDTVYAAAKYSVVWPEKIGTTDFEALRDSLISATFGNASKTMTFDEAAKAYLNSPVEAMRSESDSTFTASVVPFDTAYNAGRQNVNLTISDVNLLTPQLLVIQVAGYTYFYGAAHGMQTVRYINYSLVDHKLLSAENMFKPGSTTAILDLINASAKQHYPEEGALFADPIASVGSVEITENDIVFVYQPYDVAPYSTGIVRLPVNKYDLYRFLTPEAISAISAND